MDLQVNSSKSATDYIKEESKYSLKKRKLQQWIYLNQLTQPYVRWQSIKSVRITMTI